MDLNVNDLLKLIKDVEKNNNGKKAKIISPEKYKDVLGDTFCNRRVEYSNENSNLVLDYNKLYVIAENEIDCDLS